MEHLFSQNSSGDLRSDARQSQIIVGDADVDHTQIIGGDTVKLFGGYIPHPPGFRRPCGPGALRPTNSTPMQSICMRIFLQLFCHIDNPPR